MSSLRNCLAWVGCALFSVGLLLQSVSGATRRDDQPDSLYLNLAAQPAFAAIGQFSGGLSGSATLIASDWVLTAAHLLVSSSSTFTINGNSYAAVQWFVHPGWTGDAFNGNDLVLVRLSTPVLDVTPAPLYTESDEFDQMATFVGYGFTGTGLTGWSTLDGQKRAFQNVIDGSFSSTILLSDFDNPHNPADNDVGDPMPLLLEGCVAPGDSGGGVFLSDGTQEYLAGVISFVAGRDGNGNSDYGDVSGFARVSEFVPWIYSVVPEPSTAMLVLLGGVGGWMRRKRR